MANTAGRVERNETGMLIRLTADFSAETTDARRQWDKIIKTPKKNSHLDHWCPAKQSFMTEDEIRQFSKKNE